MDKSPHDQLSPLLPESISQLYQLHSSLVLHCGMLLPFKWEQPLGAYSLQAQLAHFYLGGDHWMCAEDTGTSMGRSQSSPSSLELSMESQDNLVMIALTH